MNINGKYKLFKNKCIGKGSFSIVYLGKRLLDNIDIAIKEIDISRYKTNKKILNNIENEIKILNTIKKNPHPNIVNCLDVVKIKDKIYIIMEYCENGDLSSIIGKPIKELYAQFYFVQIASGLKYLFDNGIIHRDMKPKNILLTNRRKVLKITDFGFAKYNYNNNFFDTVCGSPLYMSPEIIKGEKYNNMSDLWSVGMILYEMLFGKHPLNHCKTAKQLLNDVKTNSIKIPPDNITNKTLSHECLSLLKMLLQKNFTKRITWTDFFNHPWINRYEYIFNNELKDKQNNNIFSVSLGSIPEKSKIIKEKEEEKEETEYKTRAKSKPIPIYKKKYNKTKFLDYKFDENYFY